MSEVIRPGRLITMGTSVDEKRQWAIRIPDSDGNTHWLNIAAPRGAGNVVWHVVGTRLVLSPDLLERVLRVAVTAQALAARDRRDW